MIDSEDLLQRFLSYVRIDTQSDHHSETTPSTEKQWVLIRKLEGELKALGLKDVTVTQYGYVLATIPATTKKTSVPRVAFLAHVDTADPCSGLAVPIVHRKYAGQKIVLPDDPSQTMSPEDTPLLKEKIGEDIITASGKTLLGADDKSGVAIVMAAARYLVLHPEVPHGPVRICFNPDEEIGRGTEKITLEELGADVAYTLDAENLGEIDYESFSADRAVVTIDGVAAHPGWAKGVMVNALRLAADFVQALKPGGAPELTSGKEGFIHPTEIRGTAERAEIAMILRDFELDGLETKRRVVQDAAEKVRKAEPRAKVEVKITAQYRNMRYWLEKDMRPVEYALEAVRRAGLTPTSEAIRGGTDGSRLTERGLPTPNLFTGFHYVHSPREWVSLQDMVKGAETVVHLAKLWEERS
ncbi:MAG TPA: peptidase T [Planctomycetota bacterium]|nr:peptidase T [Planctomycetota bacterium]